MNKAVAMMAFPLMLMAGAMFASPAEAAVAEDWIGRNPADRIDGDTLFGIWSPFGGSGCDNLPLTVLKGLFGTVESPQPRSFTAYNCETVSCQSGSRSNSGAFLLDFARLDSMMYYAGNTPLGVQYCAMSYYGRYHQGEGWTCYLRPATNLRFNLMSSTKMAALLRDTFRGAGSDRTLKRTGLQPWPPSYAVGC